MSHFKGKVYASQVNRKTGQPLSVRDMESPAVLREPAVEFASGRRLVRQKRFNIEPMDVEEAANEMESLGHTFFLFRNRTTGALNVVYQRWDGEFGLIEPEEA